MTGSPANRALVRTSRALSAHSRESLTSEPPARCALTCGFSVDLQGRLSNPFPRPVQRRLSTADVNDICATYLRGTSIDALARSHGVNRTTIITHLDQHGVPRRRVVRKMTDALVAEAAVEYLDGHSLAIVANKFNVAIRTLRREFSKAGIATRPRQGWTY
jgi:transposase-like protein